MLKPSHVNVSFSYSTHIPSFIGPKVWLAIVWFLGPHSRFPSMSKAYDVITTGNTVESVACTRILPSPIFLMADPLIMGSPVWFSCHPLSPLRVAPTGGLHCHAPVLALSGGGIVFVEFHIANHFAAALIWYTKISPFAPKTVVPVGGFFMSRIQFQVNASYMDHDGAVWPQVLPLVRQRYGIAPCWLGVSTSSI